MITPLRLRTEHGTEAGRRVTWLELFFDLVFVAAVAQVGTHLRDDYSTAGLLRFSLLFVLIWWAWVGHTWYSTRFDTDDFVQRALTWLQMFLVAVMAINATGALDSRDSAGFAAAYSVMRLVQVAQYLRARRIWWCYFDVVDAVGEQMARSKRDAVRFHLWSYAHLPLYLGIAVAGVGLEHVIAKATKEPLHASEAVILGGALAAITISLLLIAATRRGHAGARAARRSTTPEHRVPHSHRQSRTPAATA